MDLRKDPIVLRSSASCHSKMHSQYTCDCYCKTQAPSTYRRNETQSERGPIKLLTSKSSLSKMNTGRSVKNVPFAPANLVNEDQPNTRRSTVTLPVSPVLSPETSAALEDVEKLLKDAQIQIKGISLAANSNHVQKTVNAYPDEMALDDETDQLLYIRERVAHKFQEANGWIDADTKNQGTPNERRPLMKPKRIIDFSAPKFQMIEECRKDFSRYEAFGIQNQGITSQTAKDIPSNEEKGSNETVDREAEKARKTNRFVVKTGPSVNIKRSLVAQNLREIGIPPDPSFVKESTNVGTYLVRHDHWTGSSTFKEKFTKIPEEPRSTRNNAKSTTNKQRKRLEQPNEVERIVDSSSSSGSKEKSETLEGTGDNLLENNGKSKNTEKLDDSKTTVENEKSLESNVSDIVAGSNGVEPKEERKTLSAETIGEETDCSTTRVNSGSRNEQKQVRFEERIVNETKLELPAEIPDDRVTLDRDSQTPVESNDREISKDAEQLFEEGQLTYEGIVETRCENKERTETAAEKKEREKSKRYKMVDERFANILEKYHCRSELGSTNDRLVSSSTNSDSDQSEDPDSFYRPSIDDLDNVLSAYDKIINDVSRSTRTIEKFLSRPELEEYMDKNESSESHDFESSRNRVEVTRNLHRLETEPAVVESRRKDTVPKDRSPTNKEWRSRGASNRPKTSKRAPTRSSPRIRGDHESRRRYKGSRGFKVTLVRNESSRTRERFDDSKTNQESTESEDDAIIPRRVVAKESRLPRARDEYSTTTSSANCFTPSSASDVLRAISRSAIDSVADDLSRSRPIAASTIENKDEDLDYATLHDAVCSDIMQRGFPETKDPKDMAVHLIDYALVKETRFLEEKIQNAFEANRIKSLLEQLGNEEVTSDPRNLDLVIAEKTSMNDNAAGNIHEEETKSRSEERDPGIECTSERGKEDRSGESGRGSTIPESVLNSKSTLCVSDRRSNRSLPDSKSQSSRDDEESSKNDGDSSINETRKLDSDVVESLKETSGAKDNETDPHGNENVARGSDTSKTKDLDNEKSPVYDVGEQIENEIVEIMGNAATQSVNENANSRPDANLDVINLSTIHEHTKNIPEKDSEITERHLSFSTSGATPEIIMEKSLEIHSLRDKAETVPKSINNGTRVSSSDSLRDCASLESSSKNVSKILSKIAEPSRKINDTEQLPETSTATLRGNFNDVTNQRDFYTGNMFEKKNILSDLYDDVHKKLLFSTLDTNYSSTVDRNYRLSNSVSSMKSSKIETLSSDTSRSEGELCIPSSDSYSLGEIKVLGTDGCDNSVTIFVTKEMLASWKESSQSLIQSMGEI